MAIEPLSRQDDYDLVNSNQDCRGWAVRDAAGNNLGTVAEMMIDTDKEHVDSIVLEGGQQIPATEIELRDGAVLVRDSYLESMSGTTGTAATTAAALSDSTATTATGGAGTADTRSAAGEIAIPIVEERIKVGKRQVQAGGVRVHQHVVETPVEETVRLRDESVNVERRPVNRPVTDADAAALEGGVIEVTETDEEAVVSKQARIVEEVVINKEVAEHEEVIRDTVRRTEVDVEQLDTNTKRGKRKT